MEEKKRRSLHNIFAILFSFAMVMVFAGFIGQKDVYADMVNGKDITVKVADKDNGNPIKNATVTVTIWKPTGERKSTGGGASGNNSYYEYVKLQQEFTSNICNDNGEYTVTIECEKTQYTDYEENGEYHDPWLNYSQPYIFTVGASADGYVETKTPTSYDVTKYNKKSGNYANSFARVIGERMDNLAGIGYYAPKTDFEIPLAEFDPDQVFIDYQTAALDTVKNHIKDLSKYDTEDQTDLSGIIETAQNNIKKATDKDRIDEIVADAIDKMDAVQTTQSKINEQYKDCIKFTKDGREVKLLGSGENLSITLTSTKYDKGGMFVVEGDKVSENARSSWYAKGRGYYQGQIPDAEYISYKPGEYLPDSPYILYDKTLPNCYVEFYNSNEEITRVTFTLNIVDLDINVKVTDYPKTVVLERNATTLEYTNKIAEGEDGYQVKVTSDADDKGVAYVGKATIKSLNTNIAKVDNGVIIPLRSGCAAFEASSEDNTNVKDKFYINFTLSAEEQAELDAAEHVDDLIDLIGTVTLDSESKITAARTAYKELNNTLGLGAQNKVKKLSILEAAESRLQELKDIKAAAEVDEKINAIETVTLAKESVINTARAAYNALNNNSAAQNRVKGLETLEAAEARLTVLKGYDAKGLELKVLIDAINAEVELTEECEEAIAEAQSAYILLEGEEKEFIEEKYADAIKTLTEKLETLSELKEDKLASETAAAVEQMINNLGEISLAKESDVQAARAAYEKLSANAKTKLSAATMAVLTSAEGKVIALKEAEAKKAQEAANVATAPTVQLDKITLKVKAGKAKATLTWKKSSKADGYIIYRATKKNGKYKQIKVIKSWKKATFTDKKVKSKKTYYYKICPYKGTVNGPVSAAKKAIVK